MLRHCQWKSRHNLKKRKSRYLGKLDASSKEPFTIEIFKRSLTMVFRIGFLINHLFSDEVGTMSIPRNISTVVNNLPKISALAVIFVWESILSRHDRKRTRFSGTDDNGEKKAARLDPIGILNRGRELNQFGKYSLLKNRGKLPKNVSHQTLDNLLKNLPKFWSVSNEYVPFTFNRLVTKNSCKLDLRDYPLDKQTCHLAFESCK